MSISNLWKFVWANPEQKLDEVHLNVNRTSKEIGLPHHRAESADVHLDFSRKLKEIGMGQPSSESG